MNPPVAGIPANVWAGLLAAWFVILKAAPTLLLFFVVRGLALRAVSALVRPLLARAEKDDRSAASRIRTLESLIRSTIHYSLVFLGAITLLAILGVDISALVTGAGVVGLALGIGAQRLVRDVLTGFFLLLEDQFRVGELVTLVGSGGLPPHQGTVVEIGMRITRLRDAYGKLLIIGNGDIAAVVNHSRDAITAVVDVGVPADTPLDRVREVLQAMTLPEERFTGPAELKGVTALEAERIVLRVAAPAQAGGAADAELALRQALRDALRSAEIPIK